ncbi:hypothetical protein W02_38230 [Nitrospira sp. KM1]|uniref:hypothetical protein n=1 Tax=Nitrospira sp. KM1 TaxID=1936990 RepID=UPI0013A717ED|nr:hypothetical protein [Nitrospira sp. KM1]BCA56683.1 hypothetical protein W02_38230 [Nitrospira sp. KM1]
MISKPSNPRFTIQTGYRGTGKPLYSYMEGFREIITPRLNPGLGVTHSNCISETYLHALAYCMDMADEYYSRGYGISDIRIEPFKGMVGELT